MPYVTLKQTPFTYRLNFEDVLDGSVDMSKMHVENVSNTVTRFRDSLGSKFVSKYDFDKMLYLLNVFNARTEPLANKDRLSLYSNFYQEKKGKGMKYIFREIFSSQGRYVECDSTTVCHEIAKNINEILNEHPATKDAELRDSCFAKCQKYLSDNGFDITEDQLQNIFKSSYRKIDNPCEELKTELRILKSIFENDFYALYHTSAFAYVKNRCTVDAVRRHQQNESKWFAKFDFSNFFGNTTLDFVLEMFSNIFPFSEVMWSDEGKEEMKKALSLCFLNGGLPQGTPISPLITNVMMIPIDHFLYNKLREMDKHFIYTRYADDMLVSSKYDFDCKKLQAFIVETLERFHAPFKLNEEKTRYGSSNGRNWNLGVMLNKDNQITVGYEKKKEFKAMCHQYIMKCKNDDPRDLHDVQILLGLYSYYRSVEKKYIDDMVERINNKFSVDLLGLIKSDLAAS